MEDPDLGYLLSSKKPRHHEEPKQPESIPFIYDEDSFIHPNFEHTFVIESTNYFVNKLKLSGATAHEVQGLLYPSQYTWSLGAEVHEQMSRLGSLKREPSV
ncbi:hypothetical protein TNCV_113941 [Trichonephila clavipes]|nr:hypothetical protein TNCV_113941 [Trichonephila clavipes]